MSSHVPSPARRRTGPSPLEALRRHWWLAAALPLALAVVGYVVGLGKPPTYTAEARVAVGLGNLTSGAIAGFPEAAATLAANYARYVNSSGVTDGQFGTRGVTLAASPIPESYVIRIEATGDDQDDVVAGAQKAAKALVDTVNSRKGGTDPDATLKQFQDLSAKWSQAKAASDAATAVANRLQGREGESAARETAAQNMAQEANLKIQLDAIGQKYTSQVAAASTDANLTLVRKAELTSSTKSSTAQRYLLAGLVLGGLLALAAAWLLERRRGAQQPTAPRRVTASAAPVRTAAVPPVEAEPAGRTYSRTEPPAR